MVILIIVYIISIIGAVLSIRYDQAIFDEDSWTIFLVFCPVVNSGICFIEIMDFLPISLAMRELNTSYKESPITDEELIKQYCE